MTIDPSIFKSCEIRGTYPDHINGDVAYKIGYALAAFLNPRTIAVGRDMRLSSEDLSENLTRGILDYGADVIDLGLISTDGLYFATGKFEYDGGAIITAGHHPKDYNGLRTCRRQAVPMSGQEGLGDILRAIQQGEPESKSPVRGSIVRKKISDDYARHCLSFIDPGKVKPLKIVIDAGNGMAGVSLPPVLEQLPLEVVRLYFELDGGFPNHPSPSFEAGHLEHLQQAVTANKADLGAAFSGDAERVFIIDRQGNPVGGDMVTALVAKSILNKHQGATILYNLVCSRTVPELITRMGGIAIRTRAGQVYCRPLMEKHQAVFSGEHSGHYYFRDNWFAESGLIALLICLELLSVEGRPLDEVIREIDTYVRSGEITVKVGPVTDRIEQVSQTFPDGQQDRFDGLTVLYPDFWFNLRPSNTDPILFLNVEARNNDILKNRTKQLLDIIGTT
jgi:phosphomannomutase